MVGKEGLKTYSIRHGGVQRTGRGLRGKHLLWTSLSLFWREEAHEDVLLVLCGFSWVRGQLGIKPDPRAGLQSFLRCFQSGAQEVPNAARFSWKQVHSPPLSPRPSPPAPHSPEEEALPRPYPSCPGDYVRTLPPKGLCCRVPRAGCSSPACLP